jgi:hypothetical protein
MTKEVLVTMLYGKYFPVNLERRNHNSSAMRFKEEVEKQLFWGPSNWETWKRDENFCMYGEEG